MAPVADPHAMCDQIYAVTPAVAGAMTHVGREMEPRLERLISEIKNERRQTSG